jgi:mannitol/fructose-specific phosphotransferase system IIA component
LLRNFYRNVNGRAEDGQDATQIEAMAESLAANGYVWNSFLSEFVASDAFRSAPALPVMTESQ